MAAAVLKATAASAAGPGLRRGESIVWLPPRLVGERAFVTEPLLWVLAPGDGGADPGYVRASVDSMPELRAVRLVLDPRDTTLLSLPLPELARARLLRALPNIVEDSLLQDPTTCAFALGPRTDEGARLVAVTDRAWLAFVIGAFERRGVRVEAVWPGQLVVPWGPGQTAVLCVNDAIAVRTGLYRAVGWGASADPDFRTEALAGALQVALADAKSQPPTPPGVELDERSAFSDDDAVVPATVFVDAASRAVEVYVDGDGWRQPAIRALDRLERSPRFRALPRPRTAPIDLLEAQAGSRWRRWAAEIDWRAWRWPAALAGAIVVAALIGMNLQWASLTRERAALLADMEQRFRQTFPSAQVVVDPALQMERQVASLRSRAGQPGPEDFLPMMARLSQALAARGTDALASVEYREGRLRVRFQPGIADGASQRDALREACRRLGLRLQFDDEREPSATVSLQS